jgi:phenylacetic acid degradation protein/carnitine operon protein CaiE
MNSVIMDNVVLGDECIVGALCFIKAGEKIPSRSMVVGNPSRIVKEVSDEMLQWKTEGTAIYQALPAEMKESWAACEPLREPPAAGKAENSPETDGSDSPAGPGGSPSAGAGYKPFHS